MSISSALNNAVSGLTATSRMAEVVSSNLSNALTDGYGRRAVELSALQIGGVGGGVRVAGITRFVDAGLLADRRLADAALTGQQRQVDTLTRLEQYLGDVEDPDSLGARLAAFENALVSAASDPASELRLADVLSRLQDITATLQRNSGDVQSLRQEADAAIGRDVDQLNTGLSQVAALNRDILRLESTGQDPSGLIDARQVIVDKIAGIVPLRVLPRDNGTIGLMTTTGVTLLDSRATEIGFVRTPTIIADMTLASGALSGLTIDGDPVDPATGVDAFDGGSLGAAFALRDTTLVATQAGLDGIAADLIARFADPTTDPTLVAGDPGLLTDQGAAFDPALLAGLAGRIAVNAAVSPAQGGVLSRLRDGVNASAAGPPGNGAQLDRWIGALAASRADLPGTVARSAAGRIADFTAASGTMRVTAEKELSFAAARRDTLHEAELANGVDTDIELQTLLRIEQAYAANAKVIQTVDFMMQRLMEI